MTMMTSAAAASRDVCPWSSAAPWREELRRAAVLERSMDAAGASGGGASGGADFWSSENSAAVCDWMSCICLSSPPGARTRGGGGGGGGNGGSQVSSPRTARHQAWGPELGGLLKLKGALILPAAPANLAVRSHRLLPDDPKPFRLLRTSGTRDREGLPSKGAQSAARKCTVLRLPRSKLSRLAIGGGSHQLQVCLVACVVERHVRLLQLRQGRVGAAMEHGPASGLG